MYQRQRRFFGFFFLHVGKNVLKNKYSLRCTSALEVTTTTTKKERRRRLFFFFFFFFFFLVVVVWWSRESLSLSHYNKGWCVSKTKEIFWIFFSLHHVGKKNAFKNASFFFVKSINPKPFFFLYQHTGKKTALEKTPRFFYSSSHSKYILLLKRARDRKRSSLKVVVGLAQQHAQLSGKRCALCPCAQQFHILFFPVCLWEW